MSIKLRVTLALTGIVVTLLMLAQFAGLIPDRDRLIESNRAVLAESIAIHVTSLLLEQHLDNLQRDLSYYASRNDDLVSIGLRRSDGALIASYGDHDNHWVATQGMVSTHSQIKVPIWNGEKKWGEVELHFSELVQPGIKGLLENPTVQLPAGIGIASFLLFYFLLGRMLKVLDPSRAVPSKVQNALDTLAEGLLILDQKGRIQLANDAFAGFLGEEPGALVGRYANTLDWLDNDNQPLDNNAHPWMQALATGTVRKSEPLRLRTPDGRELALQVSSSPVFTEEGQSIGVLVSFDDISELRKKEVELERSKVEAESANQAKSAFLANMSHEIRTPMNAILGFTEILKRGYVQNQEESLRYLNIINSSGKNLLDLINDILDLSKVESGKMEMEICAVEPHRVIYETLQVLALRANEKGIRLDFDVIGAIPETIQSDPTRLRQMILNLVGNAIKFTDEGGISICCRLDDSGGAPMMEISITDTGIGMTPEQTEHIFDPFSQADSTTTRRFGGTGLGLSISKKFSEALGGDIKVTSKAGVGSTFTIRIATGDLSSVRLIHPDDIELASSATTSDADLKWVFPQSRILVVDDGSENRELVRFLLEETGLTVHEAGNGREGMEKALKTAYEVVLMDVQMPVMDGFTATRELRKQGLKTPIIALTANAMKGFEQECLDAGYTGYFSKPIDVDKFMVYMAELLGGRQVTRTDSEAPPTPAGSAASDENTKGDVAEPIYSSLAADNPRFQVIAEKFLVRLNEQYAAMQEAFQAEDHEALSRLAHWLKGAGGTVGFKVLTEPAANLEKAAKNVNTADIEKELERIEGLKQRLRSRQDQENGAKDPAGQSSEKVPPIAVETITAAVESRLAGNKRFHATINRFVIKLREQVKVMEQRYSEQDMVELATLAHWLKGSAGTVGFDAFTEPAKRLEQFAKNNQIENIKPVLGHIKQLTGAVVVPSTESTAENALLN